MENQTAVKCCVVSFVGGVCVGWMLNKWARESFKRLSKRIEGEEDDENVGYKSLGYLVL